MLHVVFYNYGYSLIFEVEVIISTINHLIYVIVLYYNLMLGDNIPQQILVFIEILLNLFYIVSL